MLPWLHATMRGMSKSLPFVAFQGERGAYSEMALRTFFGEAEPLPRKGFSEVFQAVSKGEANYGILPVENSLTGSIHENFDLVLRFKDIKIVGEAKIRIQHSLIAVPAARLESIRRVLSHPQGLAQCEDYLEKHPSWEKVPFYDTAGSVAHVMEDGDPSQAAIANSLAAEIYGARVLEEGIETNQANYTRFFVIAPQDAPLPPAPDKASIVFSTPDRPGALLEAMQSLASRSLNLQKIESRPIHGRPWTYMFYLDLQVPQETGILQEALAELGEHSGDLRLLGLYRSAH